MKTKEDILNSFIKYVRIDTTANSNSNQNPSSLGQISLGKELVAELQNLNIASEQDEFGYVYAFIKGNNNGTDSIGFLAHLDTAPEVTGKNVIPQIHKNYHGNDIKISSEIILSPKDFPELLTHIGHDIITASGGTLLGADNKAGISIIMTFLKHLKSNNNLSHGDIYIAFTPDEEIGRGVDHINLKKFRPKYAYTIDGDILGSIENETFNADEVFISVIGKSVHPGSAKNKMANATRIASEIVSTWPKNMLPETTENHEGFIGFLSINGNVEKATVRGIVRDHSLDKLKHMESLLEKIVLTFQHQYPLCKIEIKFKEQYRNMKEKMVLHQ